MSGAGTPEVPDRPPLRNGSGVSEECVEALRRYCVDNLRVSFDQDSGGRSVLRQSGCEIEPGHGEREAEAEEEVACCSNTDAISPASPDVLINSESTTVYSDAEKDAAREHVLLSVTGLTCSGCAGQLEKVLASFPGITNIRVNFLAGLADFDIGDKSIDLNKVIHQVERSTAFKCIRAPSQDTFVDVMMNKGGIQKANAKLPNGVIEIVPLDKKTARVAFDPFVIGARNLVESLFPDGLGGPVLAPLDVSDPLAAAGRKRMLMLFYKTVFAAMFTIPVAVFSFAEVPEDKRLRTILSLCFATVVQALAVLEFYKPALSALFYNHTIELDLLVVISISAAYGYSVVAVVFTLINKPLETTEFFETSTLLVTLILLGRLVAAYARMRAVKSVSMRALQPDTAIVQDVANSATKEVDIRLLQYEDEFIVNPHGRIPTDGVVIHGETEVDESMITGESMPIRKTPKSPVTAGTINGSGSITVKLTRLPGKNTVSDIAHLVEEASAQRPKVQELADRVAGLFVPIVSFIALVVLIVWLVIALKGQSKSAGGAIGTSLTYMIATLAVSCPCALALAVPMVLVIAGHVASRGGVIIKSADTTERAHKVTDVVFDKTGTLTSGELEVIWSEPQFEDDETPRRYSQQANMAIVKAIVQGSKHPVSVAIAKHLETWGMNEHVKNIRSIPGSGLEATWGASTIRAGNARFVGLEGTLPVRACQANGLTMFCVTVNDQLLAVFGLESTVRPEAPAVVKELQRRGIALHMVSGDEDKACRVVGKEVGINRRFIHVRKSPAEKRDFVKQLMEEPVDPEKPDEKRIVLFCGDGTNDAIAIAQADIGVQVGSSSDLTRAIADVVLIKSNLESLIFLLDVSRAAYWRIMINFAWAAIYNVFAILLAAGVAVKWRIEPAYAGLGELVSVLPVVIVAATLAAMGYRRNITKKKQG